MELRNRLGKKIFQTTRFYPSLRSSFLPHLFYSATRSTYASVCTATHAAYKRAEIVTIPTERGAREFELSLSVTRKASRSDYLGEKGSTQSEEFKSVQSYLSKFLSEKNARARLRAAIKHVDLVGSTYAFGAHERSTIPP